MDIVWITIAFVLGLGARLVNLPPLVGYLVAGFLLNPLGVESGDTLKNFSEMGVTLLLFSIGLKLKLSSLARPQVWAVASLHMLVIVLFFGTGIYALSLTGLSLFAELDLPLSMLIAFALSFSSTVFAVKILEDKGEMSALYGRTSIGILIMQDIAAVVFLAASLGKIPSPWAILLLALIPLRPLLIKILERSGHGELLILLGLSLALGGAQMFEFAGVKGDLGALILGILFANHPKSSELSRALLGFKDLFLVGFFLSIGLSCAPTLDTLLIALLLVLLVPLKVVMFFGLLTRFRLRTRTAMLTSLNLANYSEFGLIVAAIAVSQQWLSKDWLIVIAIALSITFVVAAPLNSFAHSLYADLRGWLRKFETDSRISEEQIIDPGDANILIFGMGRVGEGAYATLYEKFGRTVVGIDFDPERVKRHKSEGWAIIQGSATDPDFWSRLHIDDGKVQVIMLALPNQKENLFAAKQLEKAGYKGRIAATAKYADEIEALHKAGVQAAFNLYEEAGTGFADHVCEQFSEGNAMP